MDTSSIELAGSEIDSITLEQGTLRVHFSRAYIIKTMTGSTERTKWWQTGELVMEGVEVEDEIPQGKLVCSGGDLVENVYTYRDMIPLPLESRGRTACDLGFKDTDIRLKAVGNTVHLEMTATPKYLQHIRLE